ncbi:50S ribosomal protein L29 [Caldithrix abyssi]|uniref:Large ribosomal subunit protein uL29 n=1 Tax=Caldithrix abyssi DSM 13497 TaxID=880073 RepID=H1XVX2_CALAY|nr:50S ribosomal protein L29 [Caldithrix abyssi]APF17661.1 rpmC LSU ribosomal protein L29P [Caldithrix abyssi DSM 13497]EHO41744.1 ribosomal protein L29 [Caldithrix abyssi DSM 13497]
MKSKEDLKGLTLDELKAKLEEAKEEYENLLLQKATHELSNPLRIRTVRREIARIKTFIRQHELGIIQQK